jgi:hypothetical protein
MCCLFLTVHDATCWWVWWLDEWGKTFLPSLFVCFFVSFFSFFFLFLLNPPLLLLQELGCIVSTMTRLWAGQSRVPMLVWDRDLSLLQNIQTSSRAQPASYWSGSAVCSSGPSVKLTTHLHLMWRLRMCGAMPPLCQYAFMTHTGKILAFYFTWFCFSISMSHKISGKLIMKVMIRYQ